MYKVILVDDDVPVVDYLRQVIPWKSLNMEVTGVFDNGKKAYEYAKLHIPDIVITDIGMPLMNGLELIAALLEHKDDVHTVILSCHDEFSFAKQAIQLNVADYILKESLEPETLIELLKKIKLQLDSEKQTKKLEVSSQLLNSLTDDPLMNEASWSTQVEQIGLDFSLYGYIPVLCFINRPLVAEERYSSQKLLMFAMQNVMEESITGDQKKSVFHLAYNGQETVLLFQYRDFVKENVYTQTEQVLEAIRESLLAYLKLTVTFIIGQLTEEKLILKENMKQLLKGKELCFYYEEGLTIKLEQINASYIYTDLLSYHLEAKQQFQQLIMNEDSEGLRTALSEWIEKLRSGRFQPHMVREWGIKILLDLRLKIQSLQFFETKFSEEIVHQNLFRVESLDHMYDVMWFYMNELLSIIHYVHKGSKRKEIIEAQNYVVQHLHEKISMADVAQKLHLNAAYFSRLFKKETNENFVDYVLRVKMEKACDYLDHSDLSIDQIAERLGFDSKSYFIRTFRRLVGMQPALWRHRI
ncbi:helix-turn-helix domain-containing protein [Paenibacillus yanchengensis]|uniref:Helix-turn-helix domain-containing protein n=1 Tax=Paenibacillus yanchengensis TaxID=2035833 RepID=A0ABW4YL71_9BACL